MRILWVNPVFLDYRIPVYKKLNDLTNGNFYLIYSQKRVPERINRKINCALGSRAISLLNEFVMVKPPKDEFANTGIRIPFQPGLYKAVSKVKANIFIAEGFFQWTPITLLAAKLKRKKILIAFELTAQTERNSPKWRTLYRKIISKFVDGFLANGQLTKEYLLKLGINEKKIFFGGMSADSEELIKNLNSFTPNEKQLLKSMLSIGKGLTYLYVGRINIPKGVLYLLNAWTKHIKEFKNDTLMIIGTGPLHEEYVNSFSEYNSIIWTGSIDYDLIYQYYSVSDVFIMPTLEDNWSLVVPEAMACGLPIGCSIYNGCYPELVHEGINGKLFDPLKEDTIIDTLSFFHYQDLEKMGSESKKIEKKYSAENVSQNIFNVCKTLMSQ